MANKDPDTGSQAPQMAGKERANTRSLKGLRAAEPAQPSLPSLMTRVQSLDPHKTGGSREPTVVDDLTPRLLWRYMGTHEVGGWVRTHENVNK